MQTYDLVAGTRNLIVSKYVSPTEALGMIPTLAREKEDGRGLKGAVRYKRAGARGEGPEPGGFTFCLSTITLLLVHDKMS